MKILFLTHFFPPKYTSGAENYTFNLARTLAKQGHQVHVLCVETWDTGVSYWNGYTEDVYKDIYVRRLNLCWHKAPDPNRYLYDNPVVARHLQEWLGIIQPDIVHITSCYTLSSSIMQVCNDEDIPLIVTLVDYWFICPSLHLINQNGALCNGQTTPWDCLKCTLYKAKAYRWPAKILPDSLLQPILNTISHSSLNRFQGLRGMALNMADRKNILATRLRQADVVLAPSQVLGDIHEAVIGELPLQIQPYGHDLTWLAEYKGRLPDNVLRFCYMGQLAHDKGVHILIEAFLEFNHVDNVALDVWGTVIDDDPYIISLRELIGQSSNICLRGRFPRENLATVLSQTDVLVVPSIWYENNPLVIQEAFAAKVPVIATNLDGMSEFVQHEVNGLLFECGNIDDLIQQMRRVVNDSELLDQLRAGITSVKTIEQEVAEVVAVYEQILKKKHGE